jgi:hypothetical protein
VVVAKAYAFWVFEVEVAVLTSPTVRYLSLLDSSVHPSRDSEALLQGRSRFYYDITSLKTRPSAQARLQTIYALAINHYCPEFGNR